MEHRRVFRLRQSADHANGLDDGTVLEQRNGAIEIGSSRMRREAERDEDQDVSHRKTKTPLLTAPLCVEESYMDIREVFPRLRQPLKCADPTNYCLR